MSEQNGDSVQQDCPPVLVVVFNREDVARVMVDALRLVAPRELFIAADGPREDHPEDVDRCQAVLAVFETIDWPCRVEFLVHDRNLGLQDAMVTAISWFFDNVEAGIILEDDCIPHPDFFSLAAGVLQRFEHEDRLMYLTAVNLAPNTDFGEASWFTASAGHVWGWATWRRAWDGYDSILSDWPAHSGDFGEGATPLRQAIGRKAQSAHDNTKRTWARAWHYHVAKSNGLVAVPSRNLVVNVGFGPDATHTTSENHRLRHLETQALNRPLVDPPVLESSAEYDRLLEKYHRWSWRRRLRERWRRARASGLR